MQPLPPFDFLPHGMCLIWHTQLLWLHVLSDAVIALSYFSIPFALAYFAVKRPDFPYRWVLFLFAAFILGCGSIHVLEIWTIWQPAYWLAGMVKLATAIVSLTTAALLWPLIPVALRIPGNSELERINRELQKEIAERAKTESDFKALNNNLENLVATRTRELSASNAQLTEEIAVRSRIERSLRESDERYRALFDQMPDPIMVVKADTGEIIDFNRRAHEHLGYSREEYRRLKISQIDRFDSDADVARRLQWIREASRAIFETQHVRKDGSVCDVLINAKLLRIAGNELIQGITTDISEFKRLEQELRFQQLELERSQRRIEHILNASPAAVYVLTPASPTGASFKVSFISDSITKITGFHPSEWTASETFWLDHVHPDDRQYSLDAQTRLGVAERLNCQYRFRHRDGGYRWIQDELRLFRDQDGAVREAIGAWLDISGLKAAEQALSRSVTLQRAILDTANDGFVLLDGSSSILDVNPAYCRMLGCDRASLLGRSLAGLEVPAEGREPLSERLQRLADKGSDRFDTRHRRSDGDALDVDLSITAFPDEQSQARYFCFVRDISERKRSESLRLAEAARQRITLINEVHHRVKNNLQGIIGLLGLHLQSHPQQAELINAIIGKIKSIAVVFGLQGQRGENDIRLCDMTMEVCRGAERLTGNPLPPTLEISVTEPVRIEKSKAVAIGLILNELVVNALKHSPPGTDIPVRVAVSTTADCAHVHIHNPSRGLPPGFDLEAGSGLGTGLTLVQAMLPQSGALLSLSHRDGEVTSHLRLSPPVIIPPGQ